MEIQSNLPIASYPKLKALGLDESQYGACTRRVKQGQSILTMGCPFARICDWADNTTYMKLDDEKSEDKDNAPRPRYVRYRESKPKSKGGFSLIESYCACFQWHGDAKLQDGKNGVIVQVTGGEGSKFTVRGTKKELGGTAKEPTVSNVPTFFKLEVPRFPKPEERADLMEAVVAGQIMQEAGDSAKDAELRRRGLSKLEGVEDLTHTVSEEDVRAAIGQGARKGQ